MSRLIRATEQQSGLRNGDTFEAWGAPLARPGYVSRERVLRALPWCLESMTTWLWTDITGVLSSCETFASASLLGGVRARSHAIASVYTEPRRRGQGHATRMLEALLALLRRADPQAHAVTLYSDVGEAIYRRHGFEPLPSFDLELSPLEGDPWETCQPILDGALPPMPPPAGERFVIWPDAGQIRWHLAREIFMSGTLKRRRLTEGLPPKSPHRCGASLGASWALWAADYKANRLRILLTEGDRDALELLLIAARRAAHRLDLEAVSLWEDETVPDLAGATRKPRDGSLAMILPLRPGLQAHHWRRRPRALWV